MALESIRYRRGSLSILNQLLLPEQLRYERVDGAERAWAAINSMEVRGAPAIALVGCLSLALELAAGAGADGDADAADGVAALEAFVERRLRFLLTARPTAVNLHREAERLRERLRGWSGSPGITAPELRERIIEHIEGLLAKDREDNERIGAHGAGDILRRTPPGAAVTVLTHCNTGSLATAGYGTALGIVRALHGQGRLRRVLCTETRPYNQGSRLTAFELLHDGIPATLIADSAAAAAMRECGVDAVVVGADRVAANGDTANKIGTFQLAVAARHHRVPFYVAAPSASCDPALPCGAHIPIEERPGQELTHLQGLCLAPPVLTCGTLPLTSRRMTSSRAASSPSGGCSPPATCAGRWRTAPLGGSKAPGPRLSVPLCFPRKRRRYGAGGGPRPRRSGPGGRRRERERGPGGGGRERLEVGIRARIERDARQRAGAAPPPAPQRPAPTKGKKGRG